MPDTTPNYGLPFPEDGDSPIDIAGDFERLATRLDSGLMIHADDPNLPTISNIGPPLHFYGEGRPDTEYPQLQAAPAGSTFTCTKPEQNNGARVWRHKSQHLHTNPWECSEGDTGLFNVFHDGTWYAGFTPNGTNTIVAGTIVGRRINNTAILHLNIWNNGFVNWQQGHAINFPVYMWPDHMISAFLPEPGAADTSGNIQIQAGINGHALYLAGNKPSMVGLGHMTYHVDVGQPWPSGITLKNVLSQGALKAKIDAIENDPDHPEAHMLDEYREQLIPGPDVERQNGA